MLTSLLNWVTIWLQEKIESLQCLISPPSNSDFIKVGFCFCLIESAGGWLRPNSAFVSGTQTLSILLLSALLVVKHGCSSS